MLETVQHYSNQLTFSRVITIYICFYCIHRHSEQCNVPPGLNLRLANKVLNEKSTVLFMIDVDEKFIRLSSRKACEI